MKITSDVQWIKDEIRKDLAVLAYLRKIGFTKEQAMTLIRNGHSNQIINRKP